MFAYYQYAETGFILDLPHGERIGIGLGRIDRREGTVADRRRAAHRGGGEQGGEESEAARHRAGPLHDDHRAAAGGEIPVDDDGGLQCVRGRRRRIRGGGGGGGFNFGGIGRPFISADGTPKIGQKLFSESFTLKSDVGNPVLRQTPINNDGSAAKPVTWIEKGVLKNVYYDAATARREKKEPSPRRPTCHWSSRAARRRSKK